MSVYVDKAIYRVGRMIMCHMISDDLHELHQMADLIGVSRRWFQNNSVPHYDICKSKRALAIQFGAVECDRRNMVDAIRRIKVKMEATRQP